MNSFDKLINTFVHIFSRVLHYFPHYLLHYPHEEGEYKQKHREITRFSCCTCIHKLIKYIKTP